MLTALLPFLTPPTLLRHLPGLLPEPLCIYAGCSFVPGDQVLPRGDCQI